jgi:hypothetical protein
VSEILMRDVTRAGRELSRSYLTDLPASLSLGQLLDTRVRTEVETYNQQPGPVFVGLVQPADSIRHSDGFRMRHARELNVDVAVAAARQAVAVEMLVFELAGERVTDLEAPVELDRHDEVLAVLERPVVAEGV